MITKDALCRLIVQRLREDADQALAAARQAHEIATHEENVPDNKYATLGLEASYLAQGQANRAQELRLAVETFSRFAPTPFTASMPVRLGALIEIVDDEEEFRTLFLVPEAGGLKIETTDGLVTLITPQAPLGKKLLGLRVDDSIEHAGKEYTLVRIA